MNLPRRALVLALLAFPSALACRSTPAEAVPKKAYTLVFLVTGPKSSSIGADEKKTVFDGHMANIRRLADEEKLLIAGPFGREKPDSALRGIFILDTPELATARAWTETDPGVRAGEFAAEYATLRTDAPLKRSLELFKKESAEAVNDTAKADDVNRIRPYAMVFGRKGDRLGSAKICFEGLLEGSSRADDIAVLDAKDPDEAAGAIGSDSAIVRDRRIATWLSTKTVAKIPR
jgi:uncharacterized protein YciI